MVLSLVSVLPTIIVPPRCIRCIINIHDGFVFPSYFCLEILEVCKMFCTRILHYPYIFCFSWQLLSEIPTVLCLHFDLGARVWNPTGYHFMLLAGAEFGGRRSERKRTKSRDDQASTENNQQAYPRVRTFSLFLKLWLIILEVGIVTVGLCLFGVVAGRIQKYTHRYKYLPSLWSLLAYSGSILGLLSNPRSFHLNCSSTLAFERIPDSWSSSDAYMVKGPVLISCRGAFSVLSVVKSLLKLLFPMQTWPSPWLFWLYSYRWCYRLCYLLLWFGPTNFPSISKPTLGSTWTAPSSLPSMALSPRRELWLSTVTWWSKATSIPPGISKSLLFACVVPLAAGLLTSNFWLGDSHNAIEVVKKIVIRSEEETREEVFSEKVKATEERIRMEVGRL